MCIYIDPMVDFQIVDMYLKNDTTYMYYVCECVNEKYLYIFLTIFVVLSMMFI